MRSPTVLILSVEEILALNAAVDWETVGPRLQRVAERIRSRAEEIQSSAETRLEHDA